MPITTDLTYLNYTNLSCYLFSISGQYFKGHSKSTQSLMYLFNSSILTPYDNLPVSLLNTPQDVLHSLELGSFRRTYLLYCSLLCDNNLDFLGAASKKPSQYCSNGRSCQQETIPVLFYWAELPVWYFQLTFVQWWPFYKYRRQLT